MSLIALIFLFALCYSKEQKPLVRTPLGPVQGYIKESFGGKKYAAFEGIPFAKPPIGDRRFEPPIPVEPWYGTWDAAHPTQCAQIGLGQPNITLGDEDCLHINVYVPRQNPSPDEKIDVIVHIHGGAYMFGSGDFYARPDFIIDKNLIFVTFNYRVGLLGFLSTEDDVVPGNNGMKDQVLALEWVQKNIASFGGNPDSVTLTGLSAGGASVHLHYFSKMSKGLFHRGFSQSGVALNAYSLQEGALQKAKILADAVGCPTSSTQILVDCLKQRHHVQLLKKTGLFYGYGILPIAPFAPVVETGSKPFLGTHPYHLLAKGEVNDVPWVSSTTAHEGFMPQTLAVKESENLERDWKSLFPIILDFNYTLDKSLWDSTSEKIKNFYFGDNSVSLENIGAFSQMFGHRTFMVDNEIAVKLHAKAAKSPVYYFSLSYPGESDQTKFVSHGADAKYFYSPVFDPTPLTANEHKMKDVLVNMLISYAKTGTPVIEGVEWTPTKYDRLTYLDVGGFSPQDIVLKTVEKLTPMDFWKSLNLKENENLVHFNDEL